jgi:hypothetical protein
MSDQATESELQQAAATGAAAAVGAVADDQRVAAEAEAARLAAETSAQIAETAAAASTMAAEAATAAISDAESSRQVAESAVEQAGSAQDAVTSLRAEFSTQLGQLTESVRSLLTLNQEKDTSNQVTNVAVSGDQPAPQKEGEDASKKDDSGAGDGTSQRRSRHKFGRRLYRRARSSCPPSRCSR